jgi:branched-chain amino acid transport system ATP-binding protein
VPDRLLVLEGVTAGYGSVTVLRDVSLHIDEGEVVAVLGANGAGKTSLLRAIVNQLHRTAGELRYDGVSVGRTPTVRLVRSGLVLVPQGRGLIPFMSVAENLQLGLDIGRATKPGLLEEVLVLFPILRDRLRQRASDLSGGEQQMLAIARALLMEPRCLMLDEPSEGLAPKAVAMVFDLFVEIQARFSSTIVIVEQNLREALKIAGRAYVLERGRVVLQGTSSEIADSPEIREAYLGGEVHQPAEQRVAP